MKIFSFINAIFAGIFATIAMDALNAIGFWLKIVPPINLSFVSGLVAGWCRGNFIYSDPKKLPIIENAIFYGRIEHYVAGVFFALIFYYLYPIIGGGQGKLVVYGLIYGMFCALVSLCLLFPMAGLGFFGLNVGIKPLVGSIYNHAVYGVALAIYIWAVGRFFISDSY